jgi:hypothetical protein
MWKLVSAGIGMLGGLLARKLMRAGYQAIRKDAAAPSPFDLTNARFSWPVPWLRTSRCFGSLLPAEVTPL